MEALIVIDAQNEFSEAGKRPVPDFTQVITVIQQHVSRFRAEGKPIAWVRHFNKPGESPAFVPDTWGAGFHPGFGPALDPAADPAPDLASGSASDLAAGSAFARSAEQEFQKNVYGAFTGSDIGAWLTQQGVDEVLITGFYTHGCVSTTAREAIMRDYKVALDPHATGSCAITHVGFGSLSADEVKKGALLQLYNMGARLI
jgi:nicotinamidase-related amidase